MFSFDNANTLIVASVSLFPLQSELQVGAMYVEAG